MARLSELLDQSLPLGLSERHAWLEALRGEDRALMESLRDALLAEDPSSLADGPLDQPPHIEEAGSGQAGAMSRESGERFGAYELLRPIGAGGMAEVWLARRADGTFEREVALKIPRLRGMPAEMTERFARECRIFASLEYPGIARLYDAGIDAGVPYIAMEYVKGEPLVDWCTARRLDEAARIRLFLQVLQAVHYAHQRDVLHRDLKPSNILVTPQGEVRLLDFGVARLLRDDAGPPGTRHAWGSALTPGYASPELLRGQALDLRSDVYSLGVVLHELLTGSRPASGPSGIARQLRKPLREVLMKALAAVPADRYADTISLAAALQPFAGHAPSSPARGWMPYLAAGLAAMALAGLILWKVPRSSGGPVSIAVLPTDSSALPRTQRDLDLAALLRERLTEIPGLRASGVDAGYPARDVPPGARGIARQPGTDYVLWSKVASEHGKLQVDVRLIDCRKWWCDGKGRSGFPMERSYALPVPDDMSATLQQIALDAARALSVKLDAGMLALDQGGTNDPDAADGYWKFREQVLQDYPPPQDPRGLAAGLLHAVLRDPQFAIGWDALADAFGSLSSSAKSRADRLEHRLSITDVKEVALLQSNIDFLREQEAWYGSRSRWARKTAERLAPDSWITWKIDAYRALLAERWQDAEQLANKVFNSSPRTLEKIKPLGDVLFTLGRVKEAIELEDLELEVAKQAMWISRNQQYNLYAARRFEEGEEEFSNSRKLPGNMADPVFLAFVRMLARTNADPAAVRARIPPSWMQKGAPREQFYRDVYAAIGDRGALHSVLRKAVDDGVLDNALIVDAAGFPDLAMEVFLKDWQEKRRHKALSGAYWHIWLMPNARGTPQFKEVLRTIGLPDYWRKSKHWSEFCRPLDEDDFECS